MQPGNTVLELRFLQGVDEEGEDILFVRRFNNIKTVATDQSVLNVVTAIAELTAYPLSSAIRRNDYDLLQLASE